ncbi:uncharacterized protein LOC141865800 isoform X2 [Acropora palmata]
MGSFHDRVSNEKLIKALEGLVHVTNMEEDSRRKVASLDKKAKPIPFEKMKKYVEVIINSSGRIRESEQDLEVVVSFLRIFYCCAEFLGEPEAWAMNVFCTVLLANIKKKQQSASDCFSEIVHTASIDSN